jgi:hypothetical protein
LHQICASPAADPLPDNGLDTTVAARSERMDPIGARQILEALVQGLDPVSGAELPQGTVVQRPEVMRALLAGVAALDADLRRSRRRAQLPENVGRPWKAEEEARLAAAFRAGEPLAEMAARHCRTVAAIEARLERLRLISPQQRTTRNRYVTRTDAPAGPSSETPDPLETRSSSEPSAGA